MMIILRAVCAILWCLLYILKPVIYVISIGSNLILKIFGGILGIGGVLGLLSEGYRGMFVAYIIIGLILIAISPLMVPLLAGYFWLSDKLYSIFTNTPMNDTFYDDEL